jgi:hypothetical protein
MSFCLTEFVACVILVLCHSEIENQETTAAARPALQGMVDQVSARAGSQDHPARPLNGLGFTLKLASRNLRANRGPPRPGDSEMAPQVFENIQNGLGIGKPSKRERLAAIGAIQT